jgi:hypothetical protein
MRRSTLDAALARVNPAPLAAVTALQLQAADDALLTGLLEQSRRLDADDSAPAVGRARAARLRQRMRRRQAAHRRRRLTVARAAAVAVAVAVVATLMLGGGSNPGGRPAPAFGARLVRFAEASPLLLLDASGWQVHYADEQTASEGEMHFASGAAAGVSGEAELHWRGGRLRDWVSDRAASADLTTTAPVLGTSAHVFRYAGGHSGSEDIAALWRKDGRVLEFRATVRDVAAFEQLLASLRRVDETTWLKALPASVISAAQQAPTVREMLRGIPLPANLDVSRIGNPDLTKDRYQLGATVAGTVACTWVKDWLQARRAGDRHGVDAAIAAMATAKTWPVLRAMEAQGAYPQVLEQYAAAMPSGEWYGRPLAGDVESGLGCAERGVPLGVALPGRAGSRLGAPAQRGKKR